MSRKTEEITSFEHTWLVNSHVHKENISIEKTEIFKGIFRRNRRIVMLDAVDKDGKLLASNIGTWVYDKNNGELQKVVSHLSYNFSKTRFRGKGERTIPGVMSAMIAHTIHEQNIPIWYSSMLLTHAGRHMYDSTLNRYYSSLVKSELNFFNYKVTPLSTPSDLHWQ